MAWVKIDDHFNEHPKLAAVGPVGWGVWLAGLAYCNRNLTDGFIPDSIAEGIGGAWIVSPRIAGTGFEVGLRYAGHQEFRRLDGRTVADILVEAGVWETAPDGFMVHDFADYQPTKEQVLEERAQKSAAGRAGGRATARARAGAPAAAETQQNSSPYPYPVPNPLEHTPVLRSVEDSSFAVGKSDLEREGLPSLTPEAVAGLQDRTGRSWSQAGDRTLGEFDRLVGDHGLEKVLAALDEVRAGRLMTAKQIVWPAGRLLEPFADVPRPDPKAAAQADSAALASVRAINSIRGQHYQHLTPHPRCPSCAEVPV